MPNNTPHTLTITKQPRHHYSAAGSAPEFEDLYQAHITNSTGEVICTFYYLALPGETTALQAKLEQLGYSIPEELLPKPLAPTYKLHQK
ncbi:hypothetical protein E4U03_09890 [Rothia nasimurium]|uniref:Uncharacterized protein n=1 Tax=Rothia nasimurium TaxID=85336 RepID=A0A4Y9F2F5_9MICC|nr:hypothetical protein [Rothia nasimurium]MBF0808910.1 hypothetical protein [Rothia nasimurium]TFU21095.1 hypothetical protein E4U03_09890 [Rothia nasimurium]